MTVGPLPSLAMVRGQLPRHCLRANNRKASAYLARVVVAMALACSFMALLWNNGLWPLYPLGWVAIGTVLTSFFILTHDCGHEALFTRPWLNRLVGHLVAAPILYPFAQWKAWHDAHHCHTNLTGQTILDQLGGEMDLSRDTAFVPEVDTRFARGRGGRVRSFVYAASRRCPPLAVALIPLLLLFFFPTSGRRARARLLTSSASAVGFAVLIGTAILTLTGSPLGIVNFWLAPLAVHAGWLGYYAFTQHTGPDIPIFDENDWSRAAAQLLGTVNTRTSALIRYLHSDPDYHVVHHLAPSIPSYHLREANDAIAASKFGHLIREVPFSISRFLRLCRDCHTWDAERHTYVRSGERPS